MSFLRVVCAAAIALAASAGPAVAEPDGEQLYLDSCASCHGSELQGTEAGPSLETSGAAAFDFYLRTGRMPLHDSDAQTIRKEPAFTPEEIAALVEFAEAETTGPEIPLSTDDGTLSGGQDLFVQNCAACHGATANGGAAGIGALAPSLYEASSLDVAEAIVVGPGEMPRFDLSTDEVASLTHYVAFLQEREDPGGADIGGIGPVPEGFVGWGVGMGALALICFAIGTRGKRRAT